MISGWSSSTDSLNSPGCNTKPESQAYTVDIPLRSWKIHKVASHVRKERPILQRHTPAQRPRRRKSATVSRYSESKFLPTMPEIVQPSRPASWPAYRLSDFADQYIQQLHDDLSLPAELDCDHHHHQFCVPDPAMLLVNEDLAAPLDMLSDEMDFSFYSDLEPVGYPSQIDNKPSEVVSPPISIAGIAYESAPTLHMTPTSPFSAYNTIDGKGPSSQPTVPVAETDELVGLGLYDTPEQIQFAGIYPSDAFFMRRKSLKLEESFQPHIANEWDAEAEVDDALFFHMPFGPTCQAQYAYTAYAPYMQYETTSCCENSMMMDCADQHLSIQQGLRPAHQGIYCYA